MPVASSIENIPHLKAFDTMAQTAFAAIDKSIVLMYLIDTAPVDALTYLAQQLDVLGYKGWLFADTEAKKRELLKKAITLHKKKGTVFAIREALIAVNPNYTGVEVFKLNGAIYDGSEIYDGSIDYASGFWAQFYVRIYVELDYSVTNADKELARRIIEEYKNERSQLVFVEFWKDDFVAVSVELEGFVHPKN